MINTSNTKTIKHGCDYLKFSTFTYYQNNKTPRCDSPRIVIYRPHLQTLARLN